MNKLKYIGFVLLLAGMLLPAAQKGVLLFEKHPLHGDFVLAKQPVFSLAGWIDGSFQTEFNSYMEQHIGFRPFFVRLNNQIAYSFYNKMSNKHIVKGKDDFLFERWFIDTYYGKDFVGIEQIENNVEKLTVIDSVLKSRGVRLIVILAPGKADVYPGKIPDFLVGETDVNTNYKVYRNTFGKTGITVFDVNRWFQNLQPEFDRNLFTRGGTHWSHDGALLALDSLFRLIEKKTGELRNKIQFDGITETRIPRDPDIDILKISNLLFENLNTNYYYPEYHYENKYAKKGKLIANSDSFFWILFSSGLKASFKDVKYWYYFSTVFPDDFTHPTTVNDIQVLKELLESDVVLLMSSPANLKKLGWGFIDKSYDLLTKDIDKELAIEQIIDVIKKDSSWQAGLIQKAEKRSITLDSMLRLDAEYLYKKR